MNIQNGRIYLQTFLLLLAGWLSSDEVLAHNFKATLSAASNAEAKYMLTCYPLDGYSTQRLSFDISALAKNRPYKLKLTVFKGNESTEATDPANGDRKPGLPGNLAVGEGAYFLTIAKVPGGAQAAKGNMVFEVDAHCLSASGYHTGTTEPVKLTTIASGITSFSGSLKAPPAAQTRYLVVCYPEAGRLTGRYGFRVRADTKRRDFGVKLTVKKDNGMDEAVDLTPGDGEFTEWGYLEEGDGAYELTLTKTAETGSTKGTMAFKVESMCESEEPNQLSGITAPIKQ